MLKEYDCWLQKRKPDTALHIPFDVIYVYEDKNVLENKKVIFNTALSELQSGIERLLGNMVTIKKGGLKDQGIIMGTVSVLRETFNFSGKMPGAEGFYIQVTNDHIVIAGEDYQGALYGVFRFLFLLASGEIKTGTVVSESPASPYRMINNWDNLDGSIERGYAGQSIFYRNGHFNYDVRRIRDYARLLASVGINILSINNVNVRNEAKLLITENYLNEAAKVADIFYSFGIRVLLSVNFGSPVTLGKLPTADPLDPAVAAWWKERAGLVYRYMPNLAGFLIKADSEGEPGPFQYNRTHADGANMLAAALRPFGGEIIWRCFVYNCTQDWRDQGVDRARAAYDHFMPLDGSFADNVMLQIKYGPYDFQVCEPVSPLFGALKKNRHILELQITQEYTGQQIDLCYLPSVWENIMNFDTGSGKIKELAGSKLEGFAAVANTGLDNNWTGHTLAQSNLYGYGRIAWNPDISAEQIAKEWSVLSFGKNNTAEKVSEILLKSYQAYEKYNAPFGVCFMVTPNNHYGPNIEGYEFSRWGTYHRADANAIGIDRGPAGTGYTGQYQKKIADMFADTSTCPENLILFFHRLRYDYIMKNGKTLLQNIYDNHFDGYDEAQALADMWREMKGELEAEVYESVLSRFERQLANAREWRDQINTYFFRRTGIPDAQGRKIWE
jgi:alpha-glucuronidase